MSKLIKLSFLFAIVALFMTSCNNDNVLQDNDVTPEPPVVTQNQQQISYLIQNCLVVLKNLEKHRESRSDQMIMRKSVAVQINQIIQQQITNHYGELLVHYQQSSCLSQTISI